MQNISMTLQDPQQRAVVGLPEESPKPKVNNPFYDATELDKAGRRKEAERIYLELLNTDFDNPVILAALGMNYAVAEKNGLAHVLLNRALANADHMVEAFKRVGIIPKSEDPEKLKQFLDIKRSELLNAIGTCYKHENRVVEARQYFEKAQSIVPINPDIQNNLGTLYINEGRPELAKQHLLKALEIDPEHAQAHWNLSLAHLELGEYAEGWDLYFWGMKAKVRMERSFSKEDLPVWDGTPGKRLVVYGEQGIGDEIMFASVLPDLLKDCPDTVFECHKKLHKLFANSFPNIDIYPTREDEVLMWPIKQDGTPRYQFDAKIAIGDIPKFYRRSLDSFPSEPYLLPTTNVDEYWRDKLATLPPGKPNIGISWIGGHKRTRVEVRSLELEKLLPILKQDANFISLQYTPCEDEIANLKAKYGITVHHWPEATYSHCYNDTAGLVANLDLVITVCTSVVHLAGSMGVPTWVLTPSRPAWRYRLDLEYMPWYSHNTLFRMQPDSTNWEPVIEEAAENLQYLMQTTCARIG